MEYTRIRNTVMSNPRGILNACMSFSLQNVIEKNIPIFFYRFNVHDLVEIELQEDLLIVYDFPFTEDRALDIKNNLDFLSGYFESAGLKNKRFLYDLRIKMTVNYSDFITFEKLPYTDNGDYAFIMNVKEGYVTETKSVNLFTTMDSVRDVDMSVLALFNKFTDIMKPKDRITLDGGTAGIFLAGLLSGISKGEIDTQLDTIDSYAKFYCSITGLKIDSNKLDKLIRGLKTDKMRAVLEIPKKEPLDSGGMAFLRDIIEMGLDRFVKQIKDNKKPVTVITDCEWQTIKRMYILDGTAFITPTTMNHLNYFRELLNSDNVEFVLN